MYRSWGIFSATERNHYEQMFDSEQDSFLNRAFAANQDIADNTYQTDFIQGIRKGNLSPDIYGSVSVLDAYYCYQAAQSIWFACGQAETDSELQNALKKFYNSYAKYNATFYNVWHVPAAQNVVPTNAFKTYAEHERNVAQNDDPIYLLPALLPCYALWAWMANKIDKDKSATPGVYKDWVDGNKGNDGVSGSAVLADQVIGNWIAAGKAFDEEKAQAIFKESMQCECRVFSSLGKY
ncbi:MAG: hypothetical protein NC419_09215 [Muribaculaceae bacterium]|nr:hypothetical protein [Muribaculaceae bacterium]